MKSIKKLSLGLLLATIATCSISSHIHGIVNNGKGCKKKLTLGNNGSERNSKKQKTKFYFFEESCPDVETIIFQYLGDGHSIKKTYSYLLSLALTNKKFNKAIKPYLDIAKQAWTIHSSSNYPLTDLESLIDSFILPNIALKIAFLSPFIFNTRDNDNNDTLLIHLVRNNNLTLTKKVFKGIQLLGSNDGDKFLKNILNDNYLEYPEEGDVLQDNNPIKKLVNQMNGESKNVLDCINNDIGAGKYLAMLFKYCGAKPIPDNISQLNEALLTAVETNNLNKAREAIINGANVSFKKDYNRTPLHVAIFYADFYDDQDIVKFLIANGANVNTKDNTSMTPLHSAVYNKSPDIIKILIEKGANVKAKTTYGITSTDIANPEIKKLIKSYENFSCILL